MVGVRIIVWQRRDAVGSGDVLLTHNVCTLPCAVRLRIVVAFFVCTIVAGVPPVLRSYELASFA
jgi:hypothetical protein